MIDLEAYNFSFDKLFLTHSQASQMVPNQESLWELWKRIVQETYKDYVYQSIKATTRNDKKRQQHWLKNLTQLIRKTILLNRKANTPY